jgi:hypothetical protein
VEYIQPAYPECSDDCPHVVSQALFVGGLPESVDCNVRFGTWGMAATTYYWYLHDGTAYSYSWTVAQDLYGDLRSEFLYKRFPGPP